MPAASLRVDSPPRTLRWPALWAVAGGAAWGACHAARPLPGLALVALAPLFLLLGARRPFLLGWLHGAVTWCVAVPWIVSTITTYGFQPGWLAALALGLLAAILGLYDGLFAALGARLWRRGDGLALAALPALWVVLEQLRAWLWTGFPWNLAAYASTEWPGALPLASWVGSYGVSAVVVLPSLGLALTAARRRAWPLALGLLLPAALLPVAARFAQSPPATDPARWLPVAVVQPDTPNRPVFDALANARDYRRLLEMSAPVCRPGHLVVWPESAAWPRDWQEDAVLRADVGRLTGEGCGVLLNSPFSVGGRTFNSLLLAGAGSDPARPQRVDKRHLVPFGEYVPLRRLLPFLGKIARLVGEFSPAERTALLDWRGEKIGAAVCYEVIFPGETAALVRRGATLLVTVTNDAWYGDTAAPRQHLRAARFRAAENRRWLVRAAITGISAVVRPDGSLARVLDVGEQGTLVAAVVGRDERSPFTRAPWLVPSLAVLLVAVALAFRRRRPTRW